MTQHLPLPETINLEDDNVFSIETSTNTIFSFLEGETNETLTTIFDEANGWVQLNNSPAILVITINPDPEA